MAPPTQDDKRKHLDDILDFLRAKLKKHTEKVEIYKYLEEDLELIYCKYTPDASVTSQQETRSVAVVASKQAPQQGACCRFTPDPNDKDFYVNSEWLVEVKEAKNAERPRESRT